MGIDLALAIWQINSQAEYVLDNNALPTEIIEWRGPGEKPSQEELEAAYAVCPLAFNMTADKTSIVGDGEDVATLTIKAPGESVEIEVGGSPVQVSLTNNVGYLEIASDTPGASILVRSTNPLYASRPTITIAVS